MITTGNVFHHFADSFRYLYLLDYIFRPIAYRNAMFFPVFPDVIKFMPFGTPTTLQRIAPVCLYKNTSISFPLLQTYLHAAQMRLSRMHFRGGKVLARVHSHDDRFVCKHTVRNPKRYGVACEGIMSAENIVSDLHFAALHLLGHRSR